MSELQQTDFQPETGLPRWGCMWLAIVVAAWLRVLGRLPRKDEAGDVLLIYNDCLTSGSLVREGDSRELTVADPSRVLQVALSYKDPALRGGQVPDRPMKHPDYRLPADRPDALYALPSAYRLSYTLINYRRPSADGHWVLADSVGRSVLYDPDEALSVDWWARSGWWRALKIW